MNKRPVTTDTEILCAVNDLNKIVRKYGKDSALKGLSVIAIAFRLLLTTYAEPNPNNPRGMADDTNTFRRRFAKMITHD